MKSLIRSIAAAGVVAFMLTVSVSAQEHKWAGRTLDQLEQTIHDRLAILPYHGVFDTLNFEVQGNTVILTGYVVKASVPEQAASAIKRLDGVENVVNRVQVLPESKRDDVLRKNLYRAIFENTPGPDAGAYGGAAVHIIVKNGAVTLEGVVNSDADRDGIYLKTLSVTHHVANNLRVSADKSRPVSR